MPRRPGFVYAQHGQRFSFVRGVSSLRYGDYGPEAERDSYGRLHSNPLPRALCGQCQLLLFRPPKSRKRPLPQSGPPPFRQRTSLVSAVPRAQPGRPAPIVARIPHLGGNNLVPRAGQSPPVGPLSISVSRFLCQRSTVSAIPSDARLQIVLVAMSRFQRSVNSPQWTRQSCFSLCRV